MAGSKSSKKVEPWQTPEWRAHCAAERQRFRDGLFYQLMAPVMGPVIVDLNGSDEEMWRREHDPVGARRLNLTRMVKARGLDPTDKYWAAYIQQGCEDESRTPAAQRKGLGARLDSLTNLAALKEECRAHGLPASGTKAKLSQRLRDYASGVEPSKGKRRRGA
ncbi:unnamed protein product [Pelagomonas calceolata]|uniref:SAP domain-containing protein n=1 Tax=Pelagomonas calceolata TaxID=35677 RepID=A0A8J2WRE9_9STRA|nr:unnamed protein product [Pelagomonas calceolata]|mmetsp:Transcript_26471/g.80294  ORF Transcript_26471/g.80294 Transcript_26471/m.80294 type:complete len:163 (-) Transcript_26471:41-529(-)